MFKSLETKPRHQVQSPSRLTQRIRHLDRLHRCLRDPRRDPPMNSGMIQAILNWTNDVLFTKKFCINKILLCNIKGRNAKEKAGWNTNLGCVKKPQLFDEFLFLLFGLRQLPVGLDQKITEFFEHGIDEVRVRFQFRRCNQMRKIDRIGRLKEVFSLR